MLREAEAERVRLEDEIARLRNQIVQDNRDLDELRMLNQQLRQGMIQYQQLVEKMTASVDGQSFGGGNGYVNGYANGTSYAATHSFVLLQWFALSAHRRGAGCGNGFRSIPTSANPSSSIASASIASSISDPQLVTAGHPARRIARITSSGSSRRRRSGANNTHGPGESSERPSAKAAYEAAPANRTEFFEVAFPFPEPFFLVLVLGFFPERSERR